MLSSGHFTLKGQASHERASALNDYRRGIHVMTVIDRVQSAAEDARRGLARSRMSALLQVSGVAMALSTFVLIPVLGRAHAAANQPAVSRTQSTARAIPAARSSSIGKKRSATRRASRSARVSIAATRASASVGTLETIVQTLNNCGPSSVAAVLAYWHIYRSEAQVATVLRADDSYWGMSPIDLPAYAQSLGMRALVGYAGTERLVKALIANGFPVIASQYVSSSDPIRHYRPIEAYNDRSGVFVSADPYLGAGHVITYGEFNAIWAESGYRFQVIYPPSLQLRLNAVLRSAGWNRTQAYAYAVRWEEQQMQTSAFQDTGSWIWYNGYADVAFDEAQLGQYRKAQAALAAGAR